MDTKTRDILGSSSLEQPCPRCGRQLKAIHTVSQYGHPSVALLECARCRYVCQTVVPGLWPEEAFPRFVSEVDPAHSYPSQPR
jgi:transcription elongation factor Elf1